MTVNSQNTPSAGKLTERDLDNVIALHRGYYPVDANGAMQSVICPPCHGDCNQGRACSAVNTESCAIEGGQHADPAPNTQEPRKRPLVGLLMVLLCWVPVLVAVFALAQLFL